MATVDQAGLGFAIHLLLGEEEQCSFLSSLHAAS